MTIDNPFPEITIQQFDPDKLTAFLEASRWSHTPAVMAVISNEINEILTFDLRNPRIDSVMKAFLPEADLQTFTFEGLSRALADRYKIAAEELALMGNIAIRAESIGHRASDTKPNIFIPVVISDHDSQQGITAPHNQTLHWRDPKDILDILDIEDKLDPNYGRQRRGIVRFVIQAYQGLAV
jgi:hypothetical protein